MSNFTGRKTIKLTAKEKKEIEKNIKIKTTGSPGL